MPTKQLIETCIWRDMWFKNLPNDLKLLFLYLLTNESINPAGIYEVDDIYLNYLGFKNIKESLKKLEPKVLYDDENNIVWITSYVKKNSRGGTIKKSIENTISKYSKSILIRKFMNYYKFMDFQLDSIDNSGTHLDYAMVYNEHDNDNDKEHEHERREYQKKITTQIGSIIKKMEDL